MEINQFTSLPDQMSPYILSSTKPLFPSLNLLHPLHSPLPIPPPKQLTNLPPSYPHRRNKHKPPDHPHLLLRESADHDLADLLHAPRPPIKAIARLPRRRIALHLPLHSPKPNTRFLDPCLVDQPQRYCRRGNSSIVKPALFRPQRTFKGYQRCQGV